MARATMTHQIAEQCATPSGNGKPEQNCLVRVKWAIVGTTPLLINAMTIQQLTDIRGRIKPAKTAPRPELREEAESKLHMLPDGRPHVPISAFLKTLINAGQFVRLDGKRQISTAKSTVLPGMLMIEDAILPIYKSPQGNETSKWEVDLQRGVNPNGNEAVCIVRPRFDNWCLRGTVSIDEAILPTSKARELFDIAGKRVGLHEFTPRHKGTFGCFRIDLWQIIPTN